jgi:hypothetical protein
LSRTRLALLLMLTLLGAGGASCPQFIQHYPSPGPRTIPQAATLADVITAVNNNSAKIRSLYTTDATVSATLIPSLRANLALERPRRFRLRAETGLTGPEADLGSNDQLFWFWVRRLQPPSMYYCSHRQFPVSRVRELVPVEPEWLIEALGITGFDPAGQHTGPTPVRGGRLEIRTQLPRSDGTSWTKVTVVDAARGLVLEQHLYDQRGTRVATSLTSDHKRDPASDAVVPHRIEIQWPATQFTLKVDLGDVQINQLSGDPSQLFEMPNYPGYQPVDVGDPSFQPPIPPPTAFAPPALAPIAPASRRWRLFR